MNKGYLDKTEVIMTSRKFKTFEYENEDLKEQPCEEFKELIKIPAIEFYKTIEFFNKMGCDKIWFITNPINSNIRFYINKEIVKIDLTIKSLYPIVEDFKSLYSIEYLKAFLKNYKIKDFKDEFIILEFSNDHPIRIKFKDDWVLLAPIINEE